MKMLLVSLVGVFAVSAAPAADVLPPKPARYFNDYAIAVRPETANELNAQLEQFERETSNQILVVIFPKLHTGSSIEDYTTRVYESWKVGQEKPDNGAVLFVFVADRKSRIQTGYGLEGALPDALSRQILDQEIAPRLRGGDFDGAMRAGAAAMMHATRGEYKGSGKTVGDAQRRRGGGGVPLVAFYPLLLIAFFVFSAFRQRRGTVYGRSGRHQSGGGWFIGPWGGGGFGGGGFGGGSWSGGGGGGGGFSGGGGSTGGGGASGSW